MFRVGFYGVTYYLGFREDFEVKVSSLAARDRIPPFFFPWVLRLFDLDRRGHRKNLLIRIPG